MNLGGNKMCDKKKIHIHGKAKIRPSPKAIVPSVRSTKKFVKKLIKSTSK